MTKKHRYDSGKESGRNSVISIPPISKKEKKTQFPSNFLPFDDRSAKTFRSLFFFSIDENEYVLVDTKKASGFAGGAKVTEARNRGNTIKYDVDKENDDDGRTFALRRG